MLEIGYDILLILLAAIFGATLGALSYWVRKVDDRQFEFAKHYVTREELGKSLTAIHEDLRAIQTTIREEARAAREDGRRQNERQGRQAD